MNLQAAVGAPQALRHEWKFACPGADVGMLRGLLEVNARRVSFGTGPVSRVHSIYFDDHRLSACHETLAGVGRRMKVRLRWYDTPLFGASAWFELKHRIARMIGKQRKAVQLDAPDSFDALRAQLIEQISDEQATWLALRSEPTVIVSYRREHFQALDSGVRVTLDYDIAGTDQLGRLAPVLQGPVGLDGLVVVEVKAGPGEVDAARRILYPWRPRLTRSSKYVQCCQALGWAVL